MSKIPDLCPNCKAIRSLRPVGERKGGFSGGQIDRY